MTRSVPMAIQVHQALHGYHEGHTLLAASLEIPRASRAVMQLLSDRSGPGDEPGFEWYLTGYPVLELGIYALAQTWMAPEMPRPGCVWTHTLLINFRDLGALPTFRLLRPLFRRPEQTTDAQDPYRELLHVAVHSHVPPLRLVQPSKAHALITALYETTEAVFLEADASTDAEDLVLSVWAQQWPRLRRGFTFCTGALAPREIGGRSFDLQVVPRARWSRFRRSIPGASFISAERSLSTPGDFLWTEFALADLKADDALSEMRTFLRTFGADMGSRRDRFPLLVEAFVLLSGPTKPPMTLLTAIGALFPAATDAKRLKAAVLGNPRPLLRAMSAVEALFGVYTLADPSAYSASGLADAKRLRDLWQTDVLLRKELLRRWQDQPLNTFGETAISELVRTVPLGELAEVLPDHPTAVRAILAVRPDTMLAAQFWNLHAGSVGAGVTTVISLWGDGWHSWEEAVRVGLHSTSAEVLLDFTEVLGNTIAGVILGEAVYEPVRLRQPLIGQLLASRPLSTWVWIAHVSEPPLALIAELLLEVPSVADAALSAPDAALSLAKQAAQTPFLSPDADIVLACLLSVALRSRAPRAREIIEVSFERVHDSLEEGRLSPAATDVLRRSLFPGASFVGVDALRRRLVQRYEAEKWGWAPLLRSVAGNSVVDQLLKLFYPEPSPKRGHGKR